MFLSKFDQNNQILIRKHNFFKWKSKKVFVRVAYPQNNYMFFPVYEFFSNMVTPVQSFFYTDKHIVKYICIAKYCTSIPNKPLLSAKWVSQNNDESDFVNNFFDKAVILLATCWFFVLSLIINISFYWHFTQDFKYCLYYM